MVGNLKLYQHEFDALVDQFALEFAMLVDAEGRVHATAGFMDRADWLADVEFAPDADAQ